MSAGGDLAWVDGTLLPRSAPHVSADDFGLRYGLTCFETMLARNGRVFRLADHLDRLEGGLRLFRVDPPPRADLEHAVTATLGANGLTEASVRLSVTPGRGGRPALPAAAGPAVIVTVDPPAPPRPPARLWVSETVRIDAQRPWRAAKVGQFAPYLLARVEAEDRGADDALLLNHAGKLVEAATANLFVFVDGALTTPPLEDGPLPGVTRACILEVAAAAGMPTREASILPGDLGRAEVVLLTSSIAGIAEVASVAWDADGDRREWRAASGSMPEALVAVRLGYERMVDEGTR